MRHAIECVRTFSPFFAFSVNGFGFSVNCVGAAPPRATTERDSSIPVGYQRFLNAKRRY